MALPPRGDPDPIARTDRNRGFFSYSSGQSMAVDFLACPHTGQSSDRACRVTEGEPN